MLLFMQNLRYLEIYSYKMDIQADFQTSAFKSYYIKVSYLL